MEVAPHTAGAAVDLTLCDDDGVELDMGTEVNATPEQSDGACYTASTAISAEAMQNRKVLVTALEAVGSGELSDGVVALVLRRPLLGHDAGA